MARKLAALVALGLAVHACRVCTQVLCHDMLTLDVRMPDGGAIERLTGVITVDGEAGAFSCPTTFEAGQDYECDGGTVLINLNWIGRIGSPNGASRAVGKGGPAMLPLTLDVPDAGLSWAGTLAPRYSTSSPNGPGCGPDCARATETVTLEAH